jgi:hypothetical protein
VKGEALQKKPGRSPEEGLLEKVYRETANQQFELLIAFPVVKSLYGRENSKNEARRKSTIMVAKLFVTPHLI